jgi:DNA polymerase
MILVYIKVMVTNRTTKLKKIKDEVLNLVDSPLYEYRTQNNYYPVLGEGSHTAKIVFVGEAPGKNEAETARPFCGAAGKILDELLASIQLNREDVYITNIVKDRPPNNRDPSQAEIDLYAPFLMRQLKIIKPKVLATLGRFSMAYLMTQFGLEDKLKPISQMHGQTFSTSDGLIIVPLYHPAVALYNRNQLPSLLKDFVVLKSLL